MSGSSFSLGFAMAAGTSFSQMMGSEEEEGNFSDEVDKVSRQIVWKLSFTVVI